ncbi:MAG: hypothetical protein M1828_003041 [Chrysothrix sp. TS-e1954]|nr:MAG: hypothetical protein M1828_003041 [Chrysothrix sp. TS-e1954]
MYSLVCRQLAVIALVVLPTFSVPLSESVPVVTPTRIDATDILSQPGIVGDYEADYETMGGSAVTVNLADPVNIQPDFAMINNVTDGLSTIESLNLADPANLNATFASLRANFTPLELGVHKHFKRVTLTTTRFNIENSALSMVVTFGTPIASDLLKNILTIISKDMVEYIAANGGIRATLQSGSTHVHNSVTGQNWLYSFYTDSPHTLNYYANLALEILYTVDVLGGYDSLIHNFELWAGHVDNQYFKMLHGSFIGG